MRSSDVPYRRITFFISKKPSQYCVMAFNRKKMSLTNLYLS